MSDSFRRFEILLPRRFNDGRPVPDELVAGVLLELRERFGAVSCETQTIRGLWRREEKVFRDDLLRVFVHAPDVPESRRFFLIQGTGQGRVPATRYLGDHVPSRGARARQTSGAPREHTGCKLHSARRDRAGESNAPVRWRTVSRLEVAWGSGVSRKGAKTQRDWKKESRQRLRELARSRSSLSGRRLLILLCVFAPLRETSFRSPPTAGKPARYTVPFLALCVFAPFA